MTIFFLIGCLLVSILAAKVGHTFELDLIPRCCIKRRALFSMLFLLLLCFTGESLAQFEQRGAIQGAVTDPSGAIIEERVSVWSNLDRTKLARPQPMHGDTMSLTVWLPGSIDSLWPHKGSIPPNLKA